MAAEEYIPDSHFTICEEDDDDSEGPVAVDLQTESFQKRSAHEREYQLVKYCQEIRLDIQSSFLPRSSQKQAPEYDPEAEFGIQDQPSPTSPEHPPSPSKLDPSLISKLEELRAELSDPLPDLDAIRNVCKSVPMTTSLRPFIWMILLGLRSDQNLEIMDGDDLLGDASEPESEVQSVQHTKEALEWAKGVEPRISCDSLRMLVGYLSTKKDLPSTPILNKVAALFLSVYKPFDESIDRASGPPSPANQQHTEQTKEYVANHQESSQDNDTSATGAELPNHILSSDDLETSNQANINENVYDAENVLPSVETPPLLLDEDIPPEYQPPKPSMLSRPVFYPPKLQPLQILSPAQEPHFHLSQSGGRMDSLPLSSTPQQGATAKNDSLRRYVGIASNSMYTFMWKYMPLLLLERNGAIQESANLLSRLLGFYHDPMLCAYLEQRKVPIERIIQPWVTDIFSSASSISTLIDLWDHILVEDNIAIPYYISLIHIIRHRSLLLEKNRQELEEWKLKSATLFEKKKTVEFYLRLARKMDLSTPISFRRYLKKIFSSPDSEGALRVLQTLRSYACLPIDAAEISKQSSTIRYFVVDCRSKPEYDGGHLPTAFFFDTDIALKDQKQLRITLEGFKQMIRTDHIALYATGELAHDTNLNTIIFQFLAHGFVRVSVVDGGFKGIHELYEINQLDIVHHNPSMCKICLEKRKPPQPRRFSGSFQNFMNATTSLSSTVGSSLVSGLFGMKSKVIEAKKAHSNETCSEYVENIEIPEDEENICYIGRSVPTLRLAERGIGEVFSGFLMTSFGKEEPRFIVLSQRSMIISLLPHPSCKDRGIVESAHDIVAIETLATNPKDSTVVMLSFRVTATVIQRETSIKYVYRIPDAHDFILGIKYHRKRMKSDL